MDYMYNSKNLYRCLMPIYYHSLRNESMRIFIGWYASLYYLRAQRVHGNEASRLSQLIQSERGYTDNTVFIFTPLEHFEDKNLIRSFPPCVLSSVWDALMDMHNNIRSPSVCFSVRVWGGMPAVCGRPAVWLWHFVFVV